MTVDLHLGDCLDVMQGIPDGSVDLILCDLPYGITDCKWDSVIPFEPLWDAYKRVAKPNAAIVFTASQPFTTDLINSNRKWFRYCLVWHKCNPVGWLNAKRQPLRVTEDICVFYEKQPVYNPQMEKRGALRWKAGLSKKSTEVYSSFYSKPVFNNDYHPTNFVNFPKVTSGTLHPTQKPVPLFEYLIRTYSNEGNTVLDNCMGSGTTGVACVNTGRKFIGIERDAEYFQIAQKRIQEAQNGYIADLFMTGKEAEL